MNSLSFPAFSKQLLTEGSTLLPPNAASSPRTLGIWMQSCRRRPNLRSVVRRCWSAINRNMSEIKRKESFHISWRKIRKMLHYTHFVLPIQLSASLLYSFKISRVIYSEPVLHVQYCLYQDNYYNFDTRVYFQFSSALIILITQILCWNFF